MQFREVIYQRDFQTHRSCLLAGDIGGTNSNFGIFEMRGARPVLLFSLHAKSQEVTDYVALVRDLMAYCQSKYGIVFEEACFGVAGIVMNDHTMVKPTNLSVTIDTHKMVQRTGLKKLLVINDFEAVVLGIEHINPKDLVMINQGIGKKHAQQACIGAGTGMGKAALIWSKHFERYLPIASEGGHADCAAQTPIEQELFAFMQAAYGDGQSPLSWENLLSGKGLSKIYTFLETKGYPETHMTQEIAKQGFKPDLISAYARKDERCKKTFDIYTTLYARCAKNFVLDVLALNGLYIAGGIAAKNVELFQQERFMEEFVRCNRHQALLQEVPIFVIADYNISLYGAIAYLSLQQQGIL